MTTYSEGDEVWVREWDGHRVPAVVQSQKMASVIVLVGDNRKRRAYDRSRVSPRNPERKPTTGTITRPFSHSQPEGVREQPKPERYEDAKYLKWIKSLPCAWCGLRPVDAHHWPTVARRGHDYQTVPLCRSDHDYFHCHLYLGAMTPEQTDAWITRTQNGLMARYIRERVKRG